MIGLVIGQLIFNIFCWVMFWRDNRHKNEVMFERINSMEEMARTGYEQTTYHRDLNGVETIKQKAITAQSGVEALERFLGVKRVERCHYSKDLRVNYIRDEYVKIKPKKKQKKA